MTTRGLWKLTAVANNMQAREDWQNLAEQAIVAGITEDEISAIAPKPTDGWRKIDKCIAKLREAMRRLD